MAQAMANISYPAKTNKKSTKAKNQIKLNFKVKKHRSITAKKPIGSMSKSNGKDVLSACYFNEGRFY